MTSPSIEKTTQKLAGTARNAGRSTVALLRDGGYATIGATDAAMTYIRRLGERAEKVRFELPDLKSLRDRGDVAASLRKFGSNVEERFDALAGRGREVVESLQRSRPARGAGARTKAAGEQVKEAAASVRDAAEADVEAVKESAGDATLDYESLTMDQLRELARGRQVPGRSDMNKAELVAALRKS
jgi:hypothetical protein